RPETLGSRRIRSQSWERPTTMYSGASTWLHCTGQSAVALAEASACGSPSRWALPPAPLSASARLATLHQRHPERHRLRGVAGQLQPSEELLRRELAGAQVLDVVPAHLRRELRARGRGVHADADPDGHLVRVRRQIGEGQVELELV